MATLSPPETTQHVVLLLDREQYAVPINSVREIVRWREPRPMPGQPRHVQGAGPARRGRDGRGPPRAAGFPGAPGANQDIVVLDLPGREPVGLTVDGVSEVLQAGEGEYRPAPSAVGCGDYVSGVLVLGDRLVVLLDLETLLDSAV
ncbi:MAG: chemotaxis protein CheW [Thermoleophilia bacterium]